MPIVYQLGADGHRGTQAVKRLVEHAPATGGLALWMQHRDVDRFPDDGARHRLPARSPIATDGLTVWYRPDFERRPLAEQTALVAHQVLHVAFRHVARRQALEDALGGLDRELWNVAADALVNASLSHLDWLALPEGSVSIERLLGESLGVSVSPEAALARWDVESLYRAIDDRSSSAASRSGRSPRRGQAGGEDGRIEPQVPDRLRDGPRAAAARAEARLMLPDLLDGEHGSPERRAEHERDWHERLGRAHAADGSRSLLRLLGADRRGSSTPWQQLLRRRLMRALAPEPELSWSRPTRHWLAARGRSRSGRRLPREPGTTSSARRTRLVVIVDVSGSIDERRLAEFGRELERIVRLHRSEVFLIVGDEVVREQRRLRPGGRGLSSLTIDGGEGTDFRPLLAAAARHAPDLVVVLTDLDGPVGERPPFEVLWATPAEAPSPTPFGSRLRLG